MNGKRILRAGLVVLFLCSLVTVGAAIPARARLVQVTWDTSVEPEEGRQPLPESFADQHVVARQRGFVMAVAREAGAMLPAALSEARRGLLENYLEPLANEFVRSYSEVGVTRTENGGALMLDVDVDTHALKERLHRLGMFATAGQSMEYVLSMAEPLASGAGAESAATEGQAPAPSLWEQVGRLQALSGLRAVQDPDMAAPVLTLRYDGKMWAGRLQTADAVYASVNEDLPALWLTVWGQYFSQPSLERDEQDGDVILEVDGCYTPDCVEAFDRRLSDWNSEVASATLVGMDMRSTGITARWSLKVRSEIGLDSRLRSFMPPRKLTWSFHDVPEHRGSASGAPENDAAPSLPGSDS